MTTKKPETIEEHRETIARFLALLPEARDALLKAEIKRRLERHPGDAPWSCVECYHGRPCKDKQILDMALRGLECWEGVDGAKIYERGYRDGAAAANPDGP